MKSLSAIIPALCLLAGCQKPTPSAPPPRPALVMPVTSHTATETTALVGEVVPRYESAQGFRIGGKIVERLVEIGGTVKKGQVLARLDPRDLRLNTAAMQADVRAAEASLDLAKAELARYRQLAARNFVSASALDIKAADLKTAQARLAQLKAQANVAGNQAVYTQLFTDRNGVVTQIRAEPGQVVEAGEVIAKIAGLDQIEIRVSVPESHIAQVRLGDKARLKLWAKPSRIYSGQVREIAPSGDSSTRTFAVRVEVKDQDADMKLGMTARVGFDRQDDEANAAILVPSTAVTEINGKPTVWIVDKDNKAHSRIVRIGSFGEGGIPVFSGLDPGERIVAAGVHTLVEGQAVRPVSTAP